jgi:hypothetical protein
MRIVEWSARSLFENCQKLSATTPPRVPFATAHHRVVFGNFCIPTGHLLPVGTVTRLRRPVRILPFPLIRLLDVAVGRVLMQTANEGTPFRPDWMRKDMCTYLIRRVTVERGTP